MKDAKFKQAPISFPQGSALHSHSHGSAIGSSKYQPDRSFADSQGRIVCVFESSSTGERKVGVAEMNLADKFFSDSATDGVLVFSLCGSSSTSPRPDTQAPYLLPHFRHLRAANRPHGLKEVFIICQKDFESCGWMAFSKDFMARAYVLNDLVLLRQIHTQSEDSAFHGAPIETRPLGIFRATSPAVCMSMRSDAAVLEDVETSD